MGIQTVITIRDEVSQSEAGSCEKGSTKWECSNRRATVRVVLAPRQSNSGMVTSTRVPSAAGRALSRSDTDLADHLVGQGS